MNQRSNGDSDPRASWLVGGGEMGKLVRSKDWSRTPLGPIDSWPQSLRTTVSLCLASNFPISLAWGPHRIQIYNDGYWPICGEKHPHSLGQDFAECWASPWPVIGESFKRAQAGETSFLENQRMFLDRNGYLEETFFTFSFSPISDETGGVGGLFHPVNELTQQILAERRLKILHDLAEVTARAATVAEACEFVAATVRNSPLDVPFCLLYFFNEENTIARLQTCAGVSPGSAASPETIALKDVPTQGWPISQALSSKSGIVNDLWWRVAPIVCAPYPEHVNSAVLLPIIVPGSELPLGVVIAGVSPRRPLDSAYSTFYDLLGKAVSSAITTARASEAERKRAEALAEMDRAKTAFFSNVSHEFRTPLTLMLGPMDDLLGDPNNSLTPAARDQLTLVHRNSLRLLKLVNTLLDFSRLEAGRIKASFEPIELGRFTTELASVFRSAVERAGLRFVVDCPPLAEPVYVDREMWEKIVFNLLSNALKFTFHGEIEIKLRPQNRSAQLSVRDTGTGIPETELPNLFERFHRVKGAKARTHEGTGIGLALVRELAKLHGGDVTVESAVHHGAKFTVSLPLGAQHLPAEQLGASRLEGSTAVRGEAYVAEASRWTSIVDDASGEAFHKIAPPPAPAKTGRGAAASAKREEALILLADDNADMRDYVTRLLKDRYEVAAFPDGAKALEAAIQLHPDLILSDIMMPGLDGFGLVKELRANRATQTIPIILLSARAGEESAVEGLDCGADDYLTKPFSAKELLARIQTHLNLARLRQGWALALEDANKELEAFSYSISHDLRAPLRSIDSYSTILLTDFAGQLPPEGQKLLQRVTNSAARMTQLIDGLLQFSKLSRQPLTKTRIKAREMVDGIIDELTKDFPARHFDLRIGDLPDAYGDPILLRQVFYNLLCNAFKYTRTRDLAKIEVGHELKDGRNIYFVRDNGAGFNMKYADKLFGVFQRLHSSSEFEGTGIGLSLVHRIILRHGGKVWAQAAPDKGANFYFTLD